MQSLNLPSFEFKLKEQGGKSYIFDRLRKQYVRLAPEEYVRQHFIHFLIEHKGYPETLLVNEVGVELGNLKKRCDTVLYDKFLHPIMIIEYKSPKVTINGRTFDQIARYNMQLHVPWLIVSNGLQHFCCRISQETGEYVYMKEIPDYRDISTSMCK